jgi:3-deoxy-D-manno-octulosonic-acid transferase
MFFIYQIIIFFIIILSPIIILIRLIKGKEDPDRFLEKFFLKKRKRPKGNLIWFHCASVGETMSIIPILDYFAKNKKINNILITTTTISSAKIIKNLNYPKLIHQFYPIDQHIITKKFINYWKPNIAIFLEAEIWPSMFFNLDKKNIPLLILNTRLSEKSFKRWMFIKRFAKKIFSTIKFCYPQNNETKFFLKKLNIERIKQIGNLKYIEHKKKEKDEFTKKKLRYLNRYKVWVAASTHSGEEYLAAKTHLLLKKKYKNLITIIIPRHINKIEKIKNELQNLNLNVVTHSSRKINWIQPDIYLVDTFGESKNFYKISASVLLGKSIYHNGGQNPLEAARYGCNILHGPNVENFKDVYSELDKLKISKKIDSEITLKNNIRFKKNYSNTFKLKKIGNKIFKETTKELNKYIKKCI